MTDITDTKIVFVVWTNTDLTEGKGRQYPLYVCDSQTTALRLAKKQGVQGTDADVYDEEAYRINNKWYAPARIQAANLSDKKIDKDRQIREDTINKAKKLGLSNEDILALSNVN